MTGTLAVVVRVLRAEGPAAARNRFLDRVEEWRCRRAFPAARHGDRIAAPVLNVLATPPARRLGGIQIQFLRRLAVEYEARATAVLYPEAGRYRLERRDGSRRDHLALPGPPLPPQPILEDAAFEAALLRAAEATQAAALHVEGVAGLPPASLLRVARRGLPLVLSLHDFALFCPRSDLIEQPLSRFCGYCRDLGRCHACLGQHWSVAADFQARYRAAGAELLHAARAVIHPSDFLRSTFLTLVPGLDPTRHRVLAPPPPTPLPGTAPPARPLRHVAYVGAVQPRKGALVFEDVVRRLEPGSGLRWSAWGGGDRDLLERLARLPGVSVSGYYRAGTLPGLLLRHQVDLALLLSIMPESYGLTLDECQEARVPVVAFDHGAIAERVRAHGGGLLVAPETGAAGVLATLRDVLDGRRRPEPWRNVVDATTRARHAALGHLALYRELGLT